MDLTLIALKINICVFLCFSFLNIGKSQSNYLFNYTDTIISTHSKYNSYIEEVIVKQYFLSKEDYKLLKFNKEALKSSDKILSKYVSYDFALFFDGADFISPFDIYSIETNEDRYDFVFPCVAYNIVLNSLEEIRLHEHINANEWGLEKTTIVFYNGVNVNAEVSISFPILKSEILKYLDESTKFIVLLENKFDEQLQMIFHIKDKLD